MIRGGYWGGAWGLSWAGAWGEAWLLLNQPYQELSLKGQVFVRSYLTRIHSAEVAEQIVSVAALNNISVLDAEAVVAAKQTVTPVEAVRLSRKPMVEIAPEHQPRQAPKAQPVAIFRQQGVVAMSSTAIVAAVRTSEASYATISTTRRELFVSQSSDEVQRKRAAA